MYNLYTVMLILFRCIVHVFHRAYSLVYTVESQSIVIIQYRIYPICVLIIKIQRYFYHPPKDSSCPSEVTPITYSQFLAIVNLFSA